MAIFERFPAANCGLLQATKDPSIFLQTAHAVEGPLAAFAGLGNIVVIVVGRVSLFFIRGRVQPEADSAQTTTPADLEPGR